MPKKKNKNEDELLQEEFAADEEKQRKIDSRKNKQEFMLSNNDMFLIDCMMLNRGLDFESLKDRSEFIRMLIKEEYDRTPQPEEDRNFV